MTCSVCKKDKPRPHNKRTCPVVKKLAEDASRGVAYEIAVQAAFACADCVAPGSGQAASVLRTGYNAMQRGGSLEDRIESFCNLSEVSSWFG